MNEKYNSKLDIYQTQMAISYLKKVFEENLSSLLNLKRVSAPLFVNKDSGLNDNLNGVERPVSFDVKNMNGTYEVVHSLAKWKRLALHNYHFKCGEGLYTDMNAIRRDEDLDNIHSIYVDQWDWEKVITKEQRTQEYLQSTVKQIVKAISQTAKYLKRRGVDCVDICEKVHFITSQDLLDKYPTCSEKEREYLITKKYKTVFIMQIGDDLSDGKPHDLRAPDYDDWSLDGDLLFYHDVLDIALEISSMGIRVDKKALVSQLEKSGEIERMQYAYHKAILQDELPLTIGGGIGQSRLCMLLLKRAHIGEVQSSYWDKQTIKECKEQGIELL